MSQYLLMKSRRFLPLFCVQFLGALEDNIFKNALIIFITFTLADKLSVNSSILVAMAGGVFILPYFLFSATAGQIADRYEKSFLIQCIAFAEILIMAFAISGFVLESVGILMTVLFLTGIQSAFFGPLKYAILPQHLAVDELTGGNGMIQMGTFLAILTGTIVGGVVVAIKPYGIYLVAGLVLCVAASAWVSSRFIPAAPASDPSLRVDWNIFSQTWQIFRQSVMDKNVFIALVAISWFWFLGATYLSLVPAYTRDVLYGNELVATLLLTAFSVGIGAGSMLCERLSRGRIEPGLVPIGAFGLSLFGLDLFITGIPGVHQGTVPMGGLEFLGYAVHWRILASLTAIGFFGGIYIVPLYAMIQDRSAPSFRARTIAANNILNALFMVASALMIIVLIKAALTIPQIFMLLAVLNLMVTGIIFIKFPEYLQRLSELVRQRK